MDKCINEDVLYYYRNKSATVCILKTGHWSNTAKKNRP